MQVCWDRNLLQCNRVLDKAASRIRPRYSSLGDGCSDDFRSCGISAKIAQNGRCGLWTEETDPSAEDLTNNSD